MSEIKITPITQGKMSIKSKNERVQFSDFSSTNTVSKIPISPTSSPITSPVAKREDYSLKKKNIIPTPAIKLAVPVAKPLVSNTKKVSIPVTLPPLTNPNNVKKSVSKSSVPKTPKVPKIPKVKVPRVKKVKIPKPPKPKTVSVQKYNTLCKIELRLLGNDLRNIEEDIYHKTIDQIKKHPSYSKPMDHVNGLECTDDDIDFFAKLWVEIVNMRKNMYKSKNIVDNENESSTKYLSKFTEKNKLVEIFKTYFNRPIIPSVKFYRDCLFNLGYISDPLDNIPITRSVIHALFTYFPKQYAYGKLHTSEPLTLAEGKIVISEKMKKTIDNENIDHDYYEIELSVFQQNMERLLNKEFSTLEIQSLDNLKDEFHSYWNSDLQGSTKDDIYIYNCGPATNMIIRRLVDQQVLMDHYNAFYDRMEAEGILKPYREYDYEKTTFAIDAYSVICIKREFFENFDFKFVCPTTIRVKKSSPSEIIGNGNEVISKCLERKYNDTYVSKSSYMTTYFTKFTGLLITMY